MGGQTNGMTGWRDRDEDMDGWTRRSWETAVLWELKQDGAATNLGHGKPGQDTVRVASLTTGFRRSDLRRRRC